MTVLSSHPQNICSVLSGWSQITYWRKSLDGKIELKTCMAWNIIISPLVHGSDWNELWRWQCSPQRALQASKSISKSHHIYELQLILWDSLFPFRQVQGPQNRITSLLVPIKSRTIFNIILYLVFPFLLLFSQSHTSSVSWMTVNISLYVHSDFPCRTEVS